MNIQTLKELERHEEYSYQERRGRCNACLEIWPCKDAEVLAYIQDLERTRILTAREGIFEAIDAERERQERLKVERNWKWSMATPGIDHFQKIMVLTEELGEVAHAVRVSEGFAVAGNSHDNHGLWAELVQVAACAVGWLESLNEEANMVAALGSSGGTPE